MAEIVAVDDKSVLDDLQLLKARFFRKISVLKALAKSVEDAYELNQATEEDCITLQIELEELSVLREKYEADFDAFQRSNLGSQFTQEVSDVDKVLKEDVVEFIDLKTRVNKILSKIRHEKEVTTPELEDIYSLSSQMDTKEWKIAKSTAKENNNNVVEENPFRRLKSLAKGVVIIFVFYFGLGLAIYLAQQKGATNAKGKSNLFTFCGQYIDTNVVKADPQMNLI